MTGGDGTTVYDVRYDPVALVEAAIDAFRRQAWDEVPALCHPASLGAFKAQLLRQYDPPNGRPYFSVDDMLRFAPDMPREVAEYNIAQRDRMMREMQDPSRELDGITSVDEVRAAEPAALYAAWLRAHAPAREVERVGREQGIPPEVIAQALTHASDQFRFIVLGAVPDGLNVAHVLYRDGRAAGGEAVPEAGVDAHEEPPEVVEFRARQTDDERAVTALIGEAYLPRLVMCLKLPGGGWGLQAEQHLFGLGSYGVGYSVANDDAEGDATTG